MSKFQVLGDPAPQPFRSSTIIINSINEAAKKIGLYSESGLKVVYDTLGNSHGHSADAYMVVYELNFPNLILNRAYPKPIIGCSRDNMAFAYNGGYPQELINYVNLGVDSKVWNYLYRKNTNNQKFTFLSVSESNTRGGFYEVIHAFGRAFGSDKNVRLYLKDRVSSDKFKQFVNQCATLYNVEIILDDRDLNDHELEKEILAQADAHIYLNHSSTWAMTCLQAMSCGIPTLAMCYAGPREYLSHGKTGLEIDYTLELVKDDYLSFLTELGFRNHLLPPHLHPSPVVWAFPKEQDLIDKMTRIRADYELRKRLSLGGAAVASKLTWERCAANLSFVLDEFYPV